MTDQQDRNDDIDRLVESQLLKSLDLVPVCLASSWC